MGDIKPNTLGLGPYKNKNNSFMTIIIKHINVMCLRFCQKLDEKKILYNNYFNDNLYTINN